MNGLLSPDDMMLAGPQGTMSGGFDRNALMRSLLGQGEYADAGMILPYAKTPEGQTVWSFPAPIQAIARTSARAMGGMPLEFDPNTGLPSEAVLADAAEAAGAFTGAGLLAPKPAGAIGMSGGGGGVTRPIPPRDIDDLGFYSQALEAATLLPQAKGTGQQMEAMLLKAGVKPDEIAFTPGMRGLLDQPQVTREEVVGLLQQNRIRPEEEVFYGGEESFSGMNFPAEAETLDVYKAFGSDYVNEQADEFMFYNTEYFLDAIGDIPKKTQYGEIPETKEQITQALLDGNIDDLDVNTEMFLRQKAEKLAIDQYNFDPVVRLQDPDTGYEIVGSDEMGYTIRDDGGNAIGPRGNDIPYSLSEARIQAENHAMDRGLIGYSGGETRFSEYTEPHGTNYREILLQVPEYEGMKGDFYESGHFDEPNVVVHARTKDRKMAKDAGDTLYVEELQSDWGQQGRGMFIKPGEREALPELYEESNKYFEVLADIHAKESKMHADMMKRLQKKIGGKYDYYKGESNLYDTVDGKEVNTVSNEALMMEMRRAKDGVVKIAGAEVEAKDLIDEYQALQEKYYKIDAEHMKIIEQINKIKQGFDAAPFVGSSEKFAEVGIKRLLSKAVKEGKKYVSFSSGDVQYDRWNEEGLVPFYDKIIPKVAKKVAKRFDPDAEVGPMQVRMDEKNMADKAERLTIEITPKMREAIQEGVPLFIGGGQGLLVAGEQMRQDRVQPKGIMF